MAEIHREAATAAATAIIERARARAGSVTIPPAVQAALVEAALVLSLGRTSVARDYRGDVVDVPFSEGTGRPAHELKLLARSLLALGVSEEETIRICRRVAFDSIPAARAEVLRTVARETSGAAMLDLPLPGVSTNELAKRAGLNWKVARRAAEDLSMSRPSLLVSERVELNEDAEDMRAAYYWNLHPERRDAVTRLVNGDVSGRQRTPAESLLQQGSGERDRERYTRTLHIGKRPVTHGSVDGYVNHRCRCDQCRRAWREYGPRRAANDRYRRSEKGRARDERARARRGGR